MKELRLRTKSSWLALGATCLLTSSAYAGPDEDLAQQGALYQEGLDLANAGKHQQAIGKLEAALKLGEFNTIRLSLGRAHQKLGRCAEARDEYDRVEAAPSLVESDRAGINEILATFRTELAATCPGSVSVQCTGGSVRVDDGEPMPCPVESLSLTPGEHNFELADGERIAREKATIVAFETTELKLDLPALEIGETAPVEDAPSEGWGGRQWSYVIGGAGIGLLATGLVVNQVSVKPLYDDYKAAGAVGNESEYDRLYKETEDAQASNRIIIIAGGALSAAGLGLLLYSLAGDDDPAPVSVSPTDGGARVGYTTLF